MSETIEKSKLHPQRDLDKTVYPKTSIDQVEGLQAELNSRYTKTEVDDLLDDKADISTTYTKTEVNDLLDDKADTSTTYTKTEVNDLLDDKQDTLISGTNVKTINNQSLLGSGNINIQGGGGSLYEHNISIILSKTDQTKRAIIGFTFLSNNSNEINTEALLLQAIQNKYGTDGGIEYQVCAYEYHDTTNNIDIQSSSYASIFDVGNALEISFVDERPNLSVSFYNTDFDIIEVYDTITPLI